MGHPSNRVARFLYLVYTFCSGGKVLRKNSVSTRISSQLKVLKSFRSPRHNKISPPLGGGRFLFYSRDERKPTTWLPSGREGRSDVCQQTNREVGSRVAASKTRDRVPPSTPRIRGLVGLFFVSVAGDFFRELTEFIKVVIVCCRTFINPGLQV